MSMDALLATFDLPKNIVNSREKLFLLSLARRCGDNNTCWPSVKRICQDTSLDPKTIVAVRKSLLKKNLIKYTGRMAGRNHAIPEMELLYLTLQPVDKSVDNFSNPPENGSLNPPKDGGLNPPKNGSLNRTGEKISRKKSFCAHAPKNQNPKKTKAQWRAENAQRPPWADKKDISAASKPQMAREAENAKQNDVFKRSPPPQELHDMIKKLKSDLVPH